MRDIKEKLVNEYPLTKKMDCPLESYAIKLYSYVVFYDEKITKENHRLAAYDAIRDATKHFPKGIILCPGKDLIVVGHTDEEFEEKDLLSFMPRSREPFFIYYLKDDKTGKFFFSEARVLSLILSFRKVIKRFNEILNP